MTYPTCIFCQRNDWPPSKEDVFAKWIARTFPGKKKQQFRVGGGPSIKQAKQLSIEKGKLGLLTEGPCQRCNNGWISLMEEATKPYLLPLMRGEETILGR